MHLKSMCRLGEDRRLKTWRSAFFVIFFLFAVAQTAGAEQTPQASASPDPVARAKFVIGDFDGDNRPDLASVEAEQRDGRDSRYQIRLKLTTGRLQTIGLTGPVGGLQLKSRDVNGDNYPDVVVTTFWTNQPVAVLLNDGLGNFSEAEPSRFPRAFTSSEVSVSCGSYTINEATAALFQRCVSIPCEDQSCKLLPPRPIRRFIGEEFRFVTSLQGSSWFSRAPPFEGPRG